MTDPTSHADLSLFTAQTLMLTGDSDTLAGLPEPVAARITGTRFEIVRGNHVSVGTDPAITSHLVSFVTERR